MRCRLGKAVPSTPNEDERTATRRKYWETGKVLVITPEDLTDDFDRQWAANLAAKIFKTGKTANTARQQVEPSE